MVRIEVKGREWERRVALVSQKELGREAILSITQLKEEELELLVDVARGNTKKVAMVETRRRGMKRKKRSWRKWRGKSLLLKKFATYLEM